MTTNLRVAPTTPRRLLAAFVALAAMLAWAAPARAQSIELTQAQATGTVFRVLNASR